MRLDDGSGDAEMELTVKDCVISIWRSVLISTRSFNHQTNTGLTAIGSNTLTRWTPESGVVWRLELSDGYWKASTVPPLFITTHLTVGCTRSAAAGRRSMAG